MFAIVIIMILGIGAFLKYGEVNNPSQANPAWEQELAMQLESDRVALEETGRNNAAMRMFYEREIAVKEYRLEKGLEPETGETLWSLISEAQAVIGIIGVFSGDGRI